MGQTVSYQSPQEVPQTPPHPEKNSIQSSYNHKISSDILRKNFSNLENYSLNDTFENLLSIKDGKEIIEEEAFILYLGFPDEIKIGSILYRSFTYLASYPSPAHENNLLTYSGLVKAVAIYCDKVHDVILEDRTKLIFESFAEHEEHSALGITPKTGVSYQTKLADTESESSDMQEGEESKVEPLKIESINLDDDAAFLKALGFTQQKDDEMYTVSKVLCNEMIEILSCIVWLMTNEIIPDSYIIVDTKDELNASTSIDQIHELVIPIVEHMARYDTELRNLSPSEIFSSQTYIKWSIFEKFIQRNIPKVFDAFKPFFYGQFLIGQTLSQHRQKSMMIGPHIQLLPKLDETSGCLHPTDFALLSWMLPKNVLNKKEWHLLYSGSKHGFSMIRFMNHVFKYTGPTLMLIKADLSKNNREHDSKKENLLIGAYVTDRWSSTSSPRTCFGSSECCLFELHPTFELFPTSQRNTNYVYFNTSFGIGFGGTATSGPASSKFASIDENSFVIQLDNTLQYGRYRNDAVQSTEPTYTLSETRPFFDVSFEVLDIEVMGMGGEEVREKQKRDWKWEEKEAGKRSTYRKEGAGVDKEILRMAGVIDNKNHRSDVEP